MAATRLGRLWRHVTTDRGSVVRAFPAAALADIEAAIAAGERRHRGQLCVAIEPALPPARVWSGATPSERALEVFGALRVWDTEANAGVLLYILLADRDVEIVADRGIHRAVGEPAWQAICAAVEQEARAGRHAAGVLRAIAAISDVLAEHFPRVGSVDNELPDRPALL